MNNGTLYRNITISGVAGTGSTTLLRLLKERLEPEGWQGYSGGEYMRRFLQSGGDSLVHHSAEAYDESIDRLVDTDIRRQLREENGLIIESWLSGFMAQGIPGVLKILLVCSNDLDRAERLASRDGTNLSQAVVEAFERLQKNTARWSRMYAHEWEEWVVKGGTRPPDAPCFFWHPRLYDLVIDTAVYAPAACMDLVFAELRSASRLNAPALTLA